MNDTSETHSKAPVSLAWPLLLIGLGVIFLLSNLNLLPGNPWALLARLWPLALIVVGVDLIFGRRSTAGALISALVALAVVAVAILLLLIGPSVPAIRDFTGGGELQSQALQAPRSGIRQAQVRIDWDAGQNRLSAAPQSSANLIEGQVEYYENLIFDVQSSNGQANILLDQRSDGPGSWNIGREEPDWTVALHPAITYELALETGSGQNTFELGGLRLSTFTLDYGSGDVDLQLPPGSYQARLEGGSGEVRITLPDRAAARIEVHGGSGSFTPGPALSQVPGDRDSEVWETAGYASAQEQLLIEIDQGSGDVEIVNRR